MESLDRITVTLGHVISHLKVKASQAHVVGQKVKHADHLREDENPMTCLIQTHKQFVQEVELATASDQGLEPRMDSNNKMKWTLLKISIIATVHYVGSFSYST